MREVTTAGAAGFRFRGDLIVGLWVMGGVYGLIFQLSAKWTTTTLYLCLRVHFKCRRSSSTQPATERQELLRGESRGRHANCGTRNRRRGARDDGAQLLGASLRVGQLRSAPRRPLF